MTKRTPSLNALRVTLRRLAESLSELALALSLIPCLAACSIGNGEPYPEGTPLMGLKIKNLVVVDDRVAVSGQPTRTQFEALPGAGYRHVISLRGARELETGWEEAVAEQSGVDFLRLAVAGAGDLDEAHARALGDALATSGEPTLVCCRSGARAGALLALERHFVDGVTPEEALELGRRAGMASTEAAVCKVLGLSSDD